MLKEKLETLKQEVQQKVDKVTSSLELSDIRNEYLSKKGVMSSFMMELKNVANDQKPIMGQMINETKNFISNLIDSRMKELQDIELENKLKEEKIDITLSGYNFKSASKHPMNIVVDDIINIFVPLGYSVVEGP